MVISTECRAELIIEFEGLKSLKLLLLCALLGDVCGWMLSMDPKDGCPRAGPSALPSAPPPHD